MAAGSVLALAGVAAATTAAWPAGAQVPAAAMADSSSLAGSQSLASSRGAAGADPVLGTSLHQVKASQAAQRLADVKQAIAQQQAAQARAAAAKAAAAKAAAAQAAAASSSQLAAAPVQAAAQGNPQQIAESMLGSFGWSSSQFSCLQPLWNAESGWNVYASNPSSGAYGIPQALPGGKMASAGPDWQTDAATQIRWGLGYIQSVYGSPCGAWSHEQAYGWY